MSPKTGHKKYYRLTVCGNCYFYYLKESAGERGKSTSIGICRRFPPTKSGSPVVQDIDWCGEFKQPDVGLPEVGP